jgi:flagellin
MRLLTGEMGLNSDGRIGFQVGAGTSTTETINVQVGRMSAWAAKSNVSFEITDTSVAAGDETKLTFTVTGVTPAITVTAAAAGGESTEELADAIVSAVNADSTASKYVSASIDTSNPSLVVFRSATPGKTGEEFTVAKHADNDTAGTLTANVTDVAANPSLLGDFSDSSIGDPADAMDAIDLVDDAVNAIANQRAVIGAGINRLTYASDNLSNISQNTSESRSRILDTDYAQATTELARTQIIQQASTAVLAQANAQPQTVLKLLQG